MKLETHQLFAELCESLLPEASSSMSLIGSLPGSQQVTQKLHREMGLAHDQQYQPIPKIAWSDLKSSYRGAWVLIQGDKGTGAIKYNGSGYEAVASAGEEAVGFRDDRGGNVIDFLKGKIGGLRKFYTGRDAGAVKDLKSKRAKLKGGAAAGKMDQEALIKKFKPLWAKAITAAIADMKGHISNQIKNDAFEKAKKKLSQIESLQNGLEAIQAGTVEDVPGFIRSSVQVAVLMAAAHYYPDTTGEIRKASYSNGYTSTHEQGPAQLLADISGGDTAKLGTILAFFKRSLISG